MTSTRKIPAPPVPEDCSLQNYSWMMMDIVALANSETWEMCRKTPYASHACLNLWMAAWHQVPAGSLPADEDWIKRKADVPDWENIRTIALRGFYRCSDGRLYHIKMVEMVLTAWEKKRTDFSRTKAAREAKKSYATDGKQKGKDALSQNTVKGSVKGSVKPVRKKGKKGKKEGEEDTIITKEPTYPRAPAREAKSGDDDCDRIVEEFLRLRLFHWPNDSSLPGPTMTQRTLAAEWVNRGAPAELVFEVMDRVMQKHVAQGKSRPPTVINFCRLTIEDALAAYQKSGAIPNRPIPAPDRGRETLLRRIGETLSREDIESIPHFNDMTNAELEQLIEEGAHAR